MGKKLITLDEDENAIEDPFFQMEMWKYDHDLALQICSELREGKKLRTILAKPGLPPYATVIAWGKQYPQFKAEMDSAREAVVPHLHDTVIEMTEEDVDKDMAPGRRLRLDAAKWMLEKLSPGRYGSKGTQIDINAPTQIIVNTGISREPLEVVEVAPVPVPVKVNEDGDTA